MERDKEQIIGKLAEISKIFDDMHRYDYSYYVDDIIERVAKSGGDTHGMASITQEAAKASQRKVIKKAYFEMLEISDDLEGNNMINEAMELDRIRNKIAKEFEQNIFEEDPTNA